MKLTSIYMLSTAMLMSLSANTSAQAIKYDGIKHVLLISVDGLHALDLRNFSISHPNSSMAQLARGGVVYTQAHTVSPADSFPGLLALTTGGTPAVTGVYFDETYDRQLSPAGSDCRQIGTPVIYDESMDGPGAQEGKPVLNAKLLPLDPKNCKPVYPHTYLRVNTVFEVIRETGGHTAWIDKHPVYEILNGPSGQGVEDLYTPEIGSNYEGIKNKQSNKITASIERTMQYDQMKVTALINEIDGFRHNGKTSAPVPTIFGINLQAVNVGQKLAGYLDALGHPSPQLEQALAHSDVLIGQIVSALTEQKLLDSTLLIITAKHGNGPIDPRLLRHIYKSDISSVVNNAAPGAVAQITSDQSALIWLKDASKTTRIAEALAQHGKRLGIRHILYGSTLALYFPTAITDSRTPDLIIIPQQGVIYVKAGDKKKAEHGGFVNDDTNVALLIANPYLPHIGVVNRAPVFTTQVAPTLLASLRISPSALEAVVKQGTRVLPGEDGWKIILARPNTE